MMHRIVGALSATHRGGMYAGLDRFVGSKQENFGQDFETTQWLDDDISRYKLIFLGEIHSLPPIVAFQKEVMERMMKQGKLHVVMEHFSFDMQPMLDEYQKNHVSFEELVERYKAVGTEGHDLEPYKPLLEHARIHQESVKLHAGFLSRKYARQLMKESEAAALKAAAQWLPTTFLPNVTSLQGSDFHYNLFESMISGRNIHEGNPPVDRFQGIFKAQLLKDVAMAHKINCILNESTPDDRFLVIAGNGHLSNYQGVPERVLREHPELIDQCCLITCHVWEGGLLKNTPQQVLEELEAGPPGANPADFLYVFEDEEEPEEAEGDAVKNETAQAYDKVGETAHLQGNLKRARAIMTYLGYTEDQIQIAGDDAFNYQGVANPHIHAKIKEGERVLDVGSGLGIDTFIAANATGEKGKVIGIDISQREVEHARQRSLQRGLDVRFAVADMEDLPLPDNSMDVIISNGAFCLAPNKEKAFSELFRVLKPGGRISVCTSTIQHQKLDEGVDWPLCMRMFIAKDAIKPLCEKIGFVNINVDDSDSKMVYELPEEAAGELNPERNRVHVGSEEFKHLEGYNMDEICARVCVVAEKPLDDGANHKQDDSSS